MPVTFHLPRSRALLFVVALAACRPPSTPDAPPPPAADFVLAAGDSSFWVTSAGGTVHVRGAPLDLARVDGRLYEIYVTDDDRSYGDAVMVGQLVYRRDLVTDDSLLVYQDTIVPRVARQYARLHPGDTPLAPDEDESDDPLWTAATTLDLEEVAGPFVSFSLHADVERDDAPLWHTSRRGVIDLRTGGSATLAAVAGTASAEVERARRTVMEATLDSVRVRGDELSARAAAVLPHYRLDPASFSITTLDGAPAVSFALPGEGDGDAGHLLALSPIRIGEPAWWAAAASSLPVTSVDGLRDVWRHGRYEVVVHYDPDRGDARLVLRDSTSREFTVGRVPAPATRIIWLDQPPIDARTRRALTRAFDDAMLYDDAVRAVAWRRAAPPTRHRASDASRAAKHSPHHPARRVAREHHA
ncbi:MAG TPA: hypothetical protein VFY85_01315 [Gemmatimonadaceae bacterium]|nr:hypothetical protein [Gemmatimonadaceae bacterium]